MTKTVLVAEDEPYILESLRFLLGRAGYTVRAERNGLAAVDAVTADRPDLIVLDVMMPGLNGFEALQRIRQTPGLKDLPVLVLTAKGQAADRRRMEMLGATDLVTKPFSNKDLLERIELLIGAANGTMPGPGEAKRGVT
ncbi:MAG: response regulator [Azospirillaceae bacterium]